MYAVIETGGKQYRVTDGERLTVEKLEGEIGSKLTLGKVLLVADGDKVTLGKPTVAGAKVEATVLSQDRTQKVRVVKFKRRTGYHHRIGHRQSVTTLRVEKISLA